MSVDLQGRVKYGKLHVQGEGVTINRYYGVAADIEITNSDILNFLDDIPRTLPSLAETDAKYFPIKGSLNDDGTVTLRIADTNIALIVECGTLAEFIREME